MKRTVFPNHYHGPYVIAAALIGAATGFLHQLYWPIHNHFFPRFGAFFSWTPLIALLFGIVINMAIRKNCPHGRWRFAMGASTTAGACVIMVVFDPFNGAPQPTISGLASQVAFALGSGVLIGGTAILVLWRLRDEVFGVPRIQDGYLCVYCAYVIRGLPEPRCPECGQAIKDAEIGPNPEPVSQAWRRLGVKTAGLLLLGYVVSLVFPHVLAFGFLRNAIGFDLALPYLKLRPESSAEVLGGYLGHHDAMIRASAANALMEFPSRSEPTKDSLHRLALSDPDALVRQMATQSIGWIEPRHLERMLPALLRDSEPECRWTALATSSPYQVGVTEPDHWSVPHLIEALTDPDVTNRGYIYRRLVALTGMRFPYSPGALREPRLKQQAKWRDWWRTRNKPVDPAANP